MCVCVGGGMGQTPGSSFPAITGAAAWNSPGREAGWHRDTEARRRWPRGWGGHVRRVAEAGTARPEMPREPPGSRRVSPGSPAARGLSGRAGAESISRHTWEARETEALGLRSRRGGSSGRAPAAEATTGPVEEVRAGPGRVWYAPGRRGWGDGHRGRDTFAQTCPRSRRCTRRLPSAGH